MFTLQSMSPCSPFPATAWDGTSGDVSWCLCTRETDTGMQKDAMLSADMSLQVSQIPTADLTVFEEMLKVQPAWRGVTAVHQIQLCADHCVYEWLLITEASLRAWMIYLRMALAKVGNPDCKYGMQMEVLVLSSQNDITALKLFCLGTSMKQYTHEDNR